MNTILTEQLWNKINHQLTNEYFFQYLAVDELIY